MAALRASDADREQAIDTLKAAFVHGRLTNGELGLRVGQALVSRTYADLAVLTADIPAGRPQPGRRWHSPGRGPGNGGRESQGGRVERMRDHPAGRPAGHGRNR